MAEQQDCEHCRFRAKCDRNPSSLLGRIWRWHAGLEEVHHLPAREQRRALAERYGMKKHMT